MNGKIRTLVVEDDPIQMENMINILNQTNRIDVIATAKNDFEFLYEASHNKSIELIIFDDNLNSKRRGIQVYQQLLNKGIQKPAIIVSAEKDFEVWEVLRLQICDFIEKDLELIELNTVLQNLYKKVRPDEYSYTNPVQFETDHEVLTMEANNIIFVATDPNSRGKRDMSSLVYTNDGSIFLAKASISYFKLLLKKYHFFDTGRSYCINPQYVASIDPSVQKIHMKFTSETASYSKQSTDENFINLVKEFVKIRDAVHI